MIFGIKNSYPLIKEYIRKNKDKYKINFPKNIIKNIYNKKENTLVKLMCF